MILFFANYFGHKSGAGKSASDVVAGLTATKYPVSVVSYFSRRNYAYIKQNKGFNVPRARWITTPRKLELPGLKPTYHGLRAIVRWFYWQITNLLRTGNTRRISALRPNLVIVNSFGGHEVLQRSGCRFNVPSIMVVRGSPATPKSVQTNMSLDDALTAMAQYDILMFVSSIVRDEWLEYDILSKKRTYYIPNCANENEIRAITRHDKSTVRGRLNLSIDRTIAVCVATLQHRKGQDLLVDHFEEIAKVAPNLEFIMIGASIGEWGHDLIKQVNAQDFSDRFTFLGSRKNALDYIYAADLFVLPTRSEAMPRVILESMALKTPVVASAVAGIPELIEHGIDGLLVEADNPAQLVEAIGTTVADSAGRAKMADHAFEKYWAGFSRDQQIERFDTMLAEILSSV